MMTKTKYSISAASRVTGKSRTTIAKHLKAGKLSCLDDGSGAKLIDASELLRVYGEACDFQSEEEEPRTPAANSSSTTPGNSTALQERLDKEVVERDRERQQLRDQIEHLQESLQLAQEGHNRATLLLESSTQGVGGWEDALAAIEKRLANQEAKSKQELEDIKKSAKRQIFQHKQALEEEVNKPLWRKLFG